MSAVTLETLKADFERLAGYSADQISPKVMGFFCKQVQMGNIREPDAVALASAYCNYTLARDYGLEAAMLFKLSDSAIDPRT